MKKLVGLVSLLLILTLIGLGFSKGSQMKDYSNIIVFGVFLLLIFSYLYFEKSSMGSKEIGIIAT